MNRLSYIDCKDVVELITTNVNQKKFIIFDVRGSDVGNLIIHKAVNIPAFHFIQTAPSLASMYKDYDYIIIHCMMSHSRGPMCASTLNDCYQNEKYKDSKVEIKIMRGGFERFYNNYGERRELFDSI